MATRLFALVLGIVFLLLGVLGFFPTFVHSAVGHGVGHDMAMETGYGYLFGVFPVNILHNIVHVGFGIWGVLAYSSFYAARTYSRATAVIYGILTLMGLIPVLNTTFGLIPLFGNDIWLHALIAISAAIFGWMPVERPVTRPREI